MICSIGGAFFKVIYEDRLVTLIAGSTGSAGIRYGTLLESRFLVTAGKVFLCNSTLLVADPSGGNIRLTDLESDRVGRRACRGIL